MKAGVVVFPGSNCDQDLVDALVICGFSSVIKLWHKNHDLEGCDMVFLPGGFSYGDYLRSGAIARFSPIMQEVISFANRGGLVMGICNGFQILTEAGLLPGALLRNENQQFICDYTWLKPGGNNTLLTNGLELNKAYKIPIAHGEGRFFCDASTLQTLQDKDQILFRYCNGQGEITAEANPNGSLDNIAGICNTKRNVFGMMPHPERVVDPNLGLTDGKGIFRNMLENFFPIAL